MVMVEIVYNYVYILRELLVINVVRRRKTICHNENCSGVRGQVRLVMYYNYTPNGIR